MMKKFGFIAPAVFSMALTLSLSTPVFAKENITFAAAMFAEAGRGDLLKAWVAKFNNSQNKVEVQPIAIPFSTLANTVFTQMGGGGGPDLIRFDQTDFFVALQAKSVLPIDDLIDEKKYKFLATDRFVKSGGKRYGTVFETTNYALIYNPALLKGGNPPKTFDEFLAMAKDATGKGNYGFAYRATMAERAGFWQDICNFVYGFGGNWADADGKLTLNSPKVIEAITAYKKVYDSGVTPKGADAATYRRMFWEGKIAMMVDNGGVGGILSTQAPNLKFSTAPSPFPGRDQGMTMTMLSLNANTKHKAAAGEFIRWTLQPEQQQELQKIIGAGSVATLVERTAADREKTPWLAAFDDQTPHGLPQLVHGHEAKTMEVQQIVVEAVLKVLQGGMDPKQAMDAAQKDALVKVAKR